jgi:hypothetical protein
MNAPIDVSELMRRLAASPFPVMMMARGGPPSLSRGAIRERRRRELKRQGGAMLSIRVGRKIGLRRTPSGQIGAL